MTAARAASWGYGLTYGGGAALAVCFKFKILRAAPRRANDFFAEAKRNGHGAARLVAVLYTKPVQSCASAPARQQPVFV
jgi:hypothetical protein